MCPISWIPQHHSGYHVHATSNHKRRSEGQLRVPLVIIFQLLLKHVIVPPRTIITEVWELLPESGRCGSLNVVLSAQVHRPNSHTRLETL